MTPVPTRTLVDLQVSPIGLGGNVFGWTADDATSFQVLDSYLDDPSLRSVGFRLEPNASVIVI